MSRIFLLKDSSIGIKTPILAIAGKRISDNPHTNKVYQLVKFILLGLIYNIE